MMQAQLRPWTVLDKDHGVSPAAASVDDFEPQAVVVQCTVGRLLDMFAGDGEAKGVVDHFWRVPGLHHYDAGVLA